MELERVEGVDHGLETPARGPERAQIREELPTWTQTGVQGGRKEQVPY